MERVLCASGPDFNDYILKFLTNVVMVCDLCRRRECILHVGGM